MKTLLISLLTFFTFSFANADQFGQRQVTGTAHTSSGFIRAGCHGLVFITSSGFSGSIGGATLASSTVYPIPVYPQDTLGDVYFTVTGGTLFAIQVR